MLLGGQTTSKADNLKTADEIIAKYIEAIGGRAKIDALKSMKMTGKMVMMGGMEIPLSVKTKRPNRVRSDFTFQGMTGTQAFDGKIGWMVMPFSGKLEPEKMSDEMTRIMADEADMDGPLVDYRKKGHQIELVGKDEIEGAEVYKLKVSKKNGSVEYHFLDAEYFLPIKVKGKRPFMGSEMEYEQTFGDYKEVAGLMMAHSVEQGGAGMGGTVSIEKIEVNVPIDNAEFAMPEVKKEGKAAQAPTEPAGEKSTKVEPKKEKSGAAEDKG